MHMTGVNQNKNTAKNTFVPEVFELAAQRQTPTFPTTAPTYDPKSHLLVQYVQGLNVNPIPPVDPFSLLSPDNKVPVVVLTLIFSVIHNFTPATECIYRPNSL